MKALSSESLVKPNESLAGVATLTICCLFGAAIGFYLTRLTAAAVVGGLFAFLVVRRLARARALHKVLPSAQLSLLLSTSSSLAIFLMWVWVFTRPDGTFHDQGGMLITFFIIPLSALCWLAGGPVASIFGF